jgi:hypothetical protein
MYDATLGRFLQRDPLGFDAGNPDLYSYVFDSPANATDPLGLIVIFSRSGINDPNSSIQGDIIRYIADRLNPNVTYGGHVGSSLTSGGIAGRAAPPFEINGRNIGGEGISARQQLNEEAQARAQQFPAGDFCRPRCRPRTKVGVVMVAPKMQIERIQNFLRDPNNCCDIQFLTFYSSRDLVGNQALTERDPDWSQLGRAYDIVLGRYNHGWNPNRAGPPGTSGSPLHPGNDLRATLPALQFLAAVAGAASSVAQRLTAAGVLPEAMSGALAGMAARLAAANPVNFQSEINQVLSAGKDYGYVCHSQGCNITIFELMRRCSRFAAP